jgi:hypothetical protein
VLCDIVIGCVCVCVRERERADKILIHNMAGMCNTTIRIRTGMHSSDA